MIDRPSNEPICVDGIADPSYASAKYTLWRCCKSFYDGIRYSHGPGIVLNEFPDRFIVAHIVPGLPGVHLVANDVIDGSAVFSSSRE